MRRLLDGDVLAVYRPACMGEVPTVLELLGHLSPLVRSRRGEKHFVAVLGDDGSAHLRDKE